jgi:sugar lactone lactonase YvrE
MIRGLASTVARLACAALAAGAGACVATGVDVPTISGRLEKVNDAPPAAAAGTLMPDELKVRLVDPDSGEPVAGAMIQTVVELGGGAVTPAAITTDADGIATFRWMPGKAPVRQRFRAEFQDQAVRFDTVATLEKAWTPEPFGDVDAFLTAAKVDGSTEDLEVDAKNGRILLGVPGGLVALDHHGKTSAVELTGDEPGWPLGIALDRDGNLWAADGTGKALLKIDAAGKVATIAGGEGQEQLGYPNFVAVGPKGLVHLSDSCGTLRTFDPVKGEQVAKVDFDAATEGGPNGIAFTLDGSEMYVTTENAAFIPGCNAGGDLLAPVGGLYRIEIGKDGLPGARTALAAGFAAFGDGMAFDAEGNLYVAFDRIDTNADPVVDSTIWVLPSGGSDLKRFLSTTDRVLANPAFGTGDFGETTMYVALVAIPGLVDPSMRGVVRFDPRIRGQPLLPL